MPKKTTQHEIEATVAGAPAALARIAEAEAAAWAHHGDCKAALELALMAEAALSPNVSDEARNAAKAQVNAARFALDDAEARVQKWAKLLLSFDVKVQPERRDADEKITRAEGEKCFAMMALTIRTAGEDLITALCQDVLGCNTPADVHELFANRARACVVNAVKTSVAEAHLPKWAIESVEAVI